MDGAEVGAFVGQSVVTTPHTRGRRSSTSAVRIASPLALPVLQQHSIMQKTTQPELRFAVVCFLLICPKNASSDGDAAAREHGGVVDDDERGGLRA